MAVVRARSATPWGAILFAFLFVVFLALFIVFLVKYSGAQTAAADAQKRLATIAGPQDQAFASQLISESGTPNASALGVARQQITELKKAIGAPTDTVPQIIQKTNGVVSQSLARAGLPTNASLLEGFNTLRGKLDAQDRQLASLKQDMKNLQDQVNLDKKNYDAAINSVNQTADKFKGQLATETSATAAADQARQQAIQEYEKKMSDLRDQEESDRRATVLQIEQLKEQLQQKDSRIAVLTDEIDKLRPTSKTNVGREPAGQIVRAAMGSGEVYINLGRKDHVTPGLTFAVYDPQTGVRFDNEQDAQGKGSIEVLEVGQNESLCRVTKTTKGESITAGDLIANPVYQHDKNRKFHFVVVGDFDLDGDGVATAAERDRLMQLIQSWGGVVDKQVTTQTDFLVAGTRPAAPVISTGETAPAPGSVADQRAKRQEAYDAAVKNAQESSVPILNANRFLAMIGYYNTTVVR